jgi:tetratricopeptide (TPR) repeat protein
MRSKSLAGVCLIAGVALLCYWPAMWGGLLVDDEALTQSAIIKAPNGLLRIWGSTEPTDYWPVTNTVFWIEWRLWGTDPAGYHFVNLFLHIIDSLLVWVVLRKLSIAGAFFAALLFALHPVNVESVAWIAQCKNLLAMCFYLISIFCWLQSASKRTATTRTSDVGTKQDSSTRDGETRSRFNARGFISWYLLSLAAFTLAMLSKGSVAILPVVLLLIAWWRKERIDGRFILRTAPFFLVAAVLTAVNIWFQTHGSTGNALHDVSFLQRLLGAGAILWFYLYKAAWPFDLVFLYPQWQIDVRNLAWWLPMLLALALTVLLIWQRKVRWVRSVLFAWAYFCIALIPVMGFVGVGYMQYSLVADHYQHLAIIGVVALFATTVYVGLDGDLGVTHRKTIFVRWMALTAATVITIALVYLNRRQCSLYGQIDLLYQNAADNNPDSWLAQYNLGNALRDIGRREEAFQRYRKALELNPREPNIYNNLGNILRERGQLDEAIKDYRQAVKLKPDLAQAHYNLGAALAEMNNWEDAVNCYQEAARLRSNWAEAHGNLGHALAMIGRLDEAVVQLQQALDEKPDYADAEAWLGLALAKQGVVSDAILHFEKALQLNPADAESQNNLGIALEKSGRMAEAIDCYRQALQLDPKLVEAHNNLANTLLQSDKIDGAIEHFQRALELDPSYAQACVGLAMAYQQADRRSDAIAAGQKAIELARKDGQIELAQKTEAWLSSYRANPTASHSAPPSADSKTSHGK